MINLLLFYRKYEIFVLVHGQLQGMLNVIAGQIKESARFKGKYVVR